MNEHIHARTAGYSPKRLAVRIVVLNLIIALLVWYSLQASRALYLEQAEVTNRNISRVLDENISGTFSRIDIALQAVVDEADHELATGGISEATFNKVITRNHSRLPELTSLRATTPDGDAIYGPTTKAASTTSLAHRDYFTLLKGTPDAGLVASEPLVGGISGKWMIVLARRFNRPDGSFAGLVYAGLPLDHLTRSFQDLNVGHNGSISLFDSHLHLVARHAPASPNIAPNRQTASSRLQELIWSGSRDASYRAVSTIDGKERLNSFRRISHSLPFYIVTGQSPIDYLSGWRAEAAKMSLFLATFATASIFSAWFYHRQRVTAQKAERDVAISEERFRTFVEKANDILYTLNRQGTFTYVSPNLEEVLGYYDGTLPGDSFESLIHPDDTRVCRDHVRQLFRSGQSGEIEYRIRHADGSWHWHASSTTLISDPSSGEPMCLGIARDITDRKRAGEVLQTVNEELETRVAERTKTAEELSRTLQEIVECMSDWVWSVDERWCYTFCSPKVEGILGYHPDEMIGKTPFDFMTGSEVERVRAEFDSAALRGRQIRDMESWYVTKDGRQVLFSTSCVPIIAESGSLAGYRGVDRDLTAQWKMEQQLFQSRKLEAIGQLAGGVAHDFNNKLMVILGCVELIRMDIDDQERILDYLREIGNAADHSRQITMQLLGFSRQQVVTPLVLDVNPLISETSKPLARLIGEHISFRFLPGDKLWHIHIDPVQFDQIIMNIAVNARDAMPDGGTFTVESGNSILAEQYTTQFVNIPPGEYVRISFSDTGSGIDQETLKHIFEPFFTTKSLGKGTGLGLATVHGIVHQNGGYINVMSRPGEGTTFTVFFPRHEQQVPSLPEREEFLFTGGGSLLLVEDEGPLREMSATFLRKLGFIVHDVAVPSRALELAADPSLHLDFVLTDVIMPEMNGIELVERLRTTRPGIRAVYVSGYSSDHKALGELGSDSVFLQKPYGIKKIGAILSSLTAGDAPPTGPTGNA